MAEFGGQPIATITTAQVERWLAASTRSRSPNAPSTSTASWCARCLSTPSDGRISTASRPTSPGRPRSAASPTPSCSTSTSPRRSPRSRAPHARAGIATLAAGDLRCRARGAPPSRRPGRRPLHRRRVHGAAAGRAARAALALCELRARNSHGRRVLGGGEVTSPKSRRPRTVPLATPPAAELARLADRRWFTSSDDLVFCSTLGDRLDPSALRRRLRRAQDAAGLRPLRFHDLRHSFGSLVVREVDTATLKAWMGHAKLTTTERYLHAKPRHTDVARLDRAFAAEQMPRSSDEPAGAVLRTRRLLSDVRALPPQASTRV